MTHPRWPRVLDIAAVALVFNLCAAPVEAAASEPPAWAQVEQPFRVGQGAIEPTLAKERVKGAGMTTYTSDEWEQELAHQDWVEQTKMVSEYMVKSITENPEHVGYIVAVLERPRQPHYPRVYRWEQN